MKNIVLFMSAVAGAGTPDLVCGLWDGIAMTVGPGAASVPANGDAQIFDNFDPGDPARICLGRRGFLVFDARPPDGRAQFPEGSGAVAYRLCPPAAVAPGAHVGKQTAFESHGGDRLPQKERLTTLVRRVSCEHSTEE